VDFYRVNRDHLKQWDPPRPAGFYTETYWRDTLTRWRAEQGEERSLRLWIAAKDAERGPLLGTVSFSRLVRGPFQCAGLGYALAAAAQGQGLMQEALRTAIDFMFEERGYHRLEANYRPENARSGRLLAHLGFVVEGYARRYLLIDGDWRDHVLTSLTRPAPWSS
jgi:ribosomal-protein-alanine N-acetyltransferase